MGSRSPSVLLAASARGVLAAFACENDDSEYDPSRTLLRDSAGIKIAENPRPPDGSILSVLTPEGADTVIVRLSDSEGRVRSSLAASVASHKCLRSGSSCGILLP